MAQDRAAQSHIDMSYTDVDTGAYVIALRESVGWSQAELARQTGIDKSDLSKIENNKRKLSGVWLIIFQEAVHREKNRIRSDYQFQTEQQQQIYNTITVKLLGTLEQIGVSESRIDGVRETMNGLIKSVLS